MENTPHQETNPLERRLDLAVAIDALESATDARLKRMGRSVKMAGFRPGKVPFAIVKQQYGAEIRHEVLIDALNEAFGKEVAGQKLNVAGAPRIEPRQSDNSTHLAFSAVFEVYPEFTPGDLSSAEIERPTLEVAAADVDKTIEILRKQRVRYVTTERPAAQEDRVVIDFHGTREDGKPFPEGEAHDYSFLLGRGMLLPEFDAAVEGMQVGEEKTIDVTFPDDYHAQELAGAKTRFEIVLKEVAGPVLPEVDEEFAKALGIEDGDIAKMRAEIEENLRHEVKKRIDAKVKEQVLEALLRANPIPVPNALVEREIQRLVDGARENLEQRGLRARDVPVRPEWFTDKARRRVTLGLIFAQVVESEKLQARPEQVKAMVEEAARTYENPAEVVRWYYRDPERLEDIENLVAENNVVEWALAKTKVTERALSFDELMGRNEA
ncbi:MAG: trigger factor [Zoogloeaceae bacterium]|jgi:trigger factor|nr:trigger factor [Zoogloeaceae bacterium]